MVAFTAAQDNRSSRTRGGFRMIRGHREIPGDTLAQENPEGVDGTNTADSGSQNQSDNNNFQENSVKHNAIFTGQLNVEDGQEPQDDIDQMHDQGTNNVATIKAEDSKRNLHRKITVGVSHILKGDVSSVQNTDGGSESRTEELGDTLHLEADEATNDAPVTDDEVQIDGERTDAMVKDNTEFDGDEAKEDVPMMDDEVQTDGEEIDALVKVNSEVEVDDATKDAPVMDDEVQTDGEEIDALVKVNSEVEVDDATKDAPVMDDEVQTDGEEIDALVKVNSEVEVDEATNNVPGNIAETSGPVLTKDDQKDDPVQLSPELTDVGQQASDYSGQPIYFNQIYFNETYSNETYSNETYFNHTGNGTTYVSEKTMYNVFGPNWENLLSIYGITNLTRDYNVTYPVVYYRALPASSQYPDHEPEALPNTGPNIPYALASDPHIPEALPNTGPNIPAALTSDPHILEALPYDGPNIPAAFASDPHIPEALHNAGYNPETGQDTKYDSFASLFHGNLNEYMDSGDTAMVDNYMQRGGRVPAPYNPNPGHYPHQVHIPNDAELQAIYDIDWQTMLRYYGLRGDILDGPDRFPQHDYDAYNWDQRHYGRGNAYRYGPPQYPPNQYHEDFFSRYDF